MSWMNLQSSVVNHYSHEVCAASTTLNSSFCYNILAKFNDQERRAASSQNAKNDNCRKHIAVAAMSLGVLLVNNWQERKQF